MPLNQIVQGHPPWIRLIVSIRTLTVIPFPPCEFQQIHHQELDCFPDSSPKDGVDEEVYYKDKPEPSMDKNIGNSSNIRVKDDAKDWEASFIIQ